MAFWLGVLVLLGEIFMPQLMRLLAPGFADDPGKFALAVILSPDHLPLSAADLPRGAGLGRAERADRFAAAAGSPMLFNVSSIAAHVWLTPYVRDRGPRAGLGRHRSPAWCSSACCCWALRRAGMRAARRRARG